MSKKIPISTITPVPADTNSDGYSLSGYYFKDEPDGLNFYNSQNVKQNTADIKLGEAFSVQIPVQQPSGPPVTKTFSITVNTLGATGSWSDLGAEADPGSGTFQAQASGTKADEEEASSATA